MTRLKSLSAATLCLMTGCGLKTGLDLSICGTADWEAKSRGADTTTERVVDVSFNSNTDFVDAAKAFDSIELATATVEVLSIDATNKATSVSGRLEVGPADGSSRVLIGEYTNLAVSVGSKVEVALTDSGKALVSGQLKSGTRSFKAYLMGTLDKAPVAVTLRARFTVKAVAAGGGIAKDLGCVALGISTDDPAPSCTPNPCKNAGQCSVGANILVCSCTSGFTGLQCETPTSSTCANWQCQNGGTCSAPNNTPTCSCASGFSGDHCETATNRCANVQCTNNHVCSQETGQCVCPAGTSGALCTPNCTLSCQNGGECVVGQDAGQSCACPSTHTGSLCETPTAACNPVTQTGCTQSQMCSFNGSATLGCVTPGAAAENAACTADADCGPTLGCGSNGSGGLICLKWCASGGACPGNQVCTPISSGFGICTQLP